jgi:hypothetical protein
VLVRLSRRVYENDWMSLPLASDVTQRVGAGELTIFLFGAANWILEWYQEGRDSLDEIAENPSKIRRGGLEARPYRSTGNHYHSGRSVPEVMVPKLPQRRLLSRPHTQRSPPLHGRQNSE